jgi:hypothetical protein
MVRIAVIGLSLIVVGVDAGRALQKAVEQLQKPATK